MTCPECRGAVVDPVRPGPEWPVMCRGCFAAVDARSEALERQFGGAVFDPDGPLRPRLQKHRGSPDFTGQRIGRLTVEGPVIRERGNGRVGRDWLVRCDCGRDVVMRSEVLRRGARECHPCSVGTGNRKGGLRGSVAVRAAAQMARAA